MRSESSSGEVDVHPSQVQQDNRLSWKGLLAHGRHVGVLFFGFLLVAVCLTLGVRILSTSSIKGVVNAPILLIQAPIDGTVITDDIKAGNTINQGDILFLLENARLDKTQEDQIRSALEQTRAEISGLTIQLEGYAALKSELEARLLTHLETNTGYLSQKIAESQSNLQKAQNAQEQAAREFKRQMELAKKGIDSQQAYEAARLKNDEAVSDILSLTASLKRNTLELQASTKGVLLDGYSGAPYAQQRLDEVALRIAEVSGRLADASRKDTALEAQLRESEKLNKKLSSATLVSPSLCLVQSIRVTKGSDVVKGTVLCELVDCAKSYVEATIPEKRFDKVKVGDPAKIYLYGSANYISGFVSSVRGAGANNGNNPELYAARISKTTPDSMIVSVSFSLRDAMEVFGSANQVGRTARVVLHKVN